MKTVSANAESLKAIFSDRYLIPEYQRKYTWADDECNRLWDDLLEFRKSWINNKAENYFLGSITVWRSDGNTPWEVVDGQQRLITLSLLIKAFHNFVQKNDKLLRCLYVEDPADDKVLPDSEIRIVTESIEDDNENLSKIIRSTDPETAFKDTKQMGKNYKIFTGKIFSWANSGRRKSDKEIKLIIQMLLNNVHILRIESGNMDDALHIFETINDRGRPLDDSDILKAKIYKKGAKTKSARTEFNRRWNLLEDPKDIFNIYMHSLKAKDGDRNTTTESPRNFFQKYDKKHNLFNDWETVMGDLEKIGDITAGNWNMPRKIMNWWEVLNVAYPGRGNRTSHWRLPLYVFLCKNINKRSSNEKPLVVNDNVQKEFEKLLKMTVKFLVIKGINYKNSGVIRGSAYSMYVAIEGKHKEVKYNSGNYCQVYIDDLQSNKELDKFHKNIKDHTEFKTYLKLLVYLGALLSPGQNAEDFNILLGPKITEIEHILPNNWKQYEKWGKLAGWTEDTSKEDINKLGNLMLLEQEYNKQASNHSFKNKKEIYAKSKFKDAIKISECGADDWTPEVLKIRDKEIRDRILKFVKI